VRDRARKGNIPKLSPFDALSQRKINQ